MGVSAKMLTEYLSYMGHALFVSCLVILTWFVLILAVAAWDSESSPWRLRLVALFAMLFIVNTTGFVIYKYITAAAV